ncbi:MAG: site-2 protease family protein [Burkholderiales bacterium]|nr:site-2 protease family protein [Burkholderiales bacterium]
MSSFLVSVLVCVLLHLAAIAAAGLAAGVALRAFSLGLGPTLLQLGRFRLGAIPLGGYVRFRASTLEEVSPDEMRQRSICCRCRE